MAYSDNIREAAREWVSEFSVIPQGLITKLIKNKSDELQELTPPSTNDHVLVRSGRYKGKHATILGTSDKDGVYVLKIDGSDKAVDIKRDSFEVEYSEPVTVFDKLWAFSSEADNRWLEERGGLQKMADCGFRIYEQQDYRYIFGVDGSGYDYFEAHWIPLYEARGLGTTADSESCCPICRQGFIPNGVSAVEHLIQGIMRVAKELQSVEYDGVNTLLPCPRCGEYRMLPKTVRNALSRHADVHVCDICGVDEACRVYADTVLPLAEWSIVKSILDYKKD